MKSSLTYPRPFHRYREAVSARLLDIFLQRESHHDQHLMSSDLDRIQVDKNRDPSKEKIFDIVIEYFFSNLSIEIR